MDPMTEHSTGRPISPEEFYDALSEEYDRMTGFEKRFAKERPYFHALVKKFNIQTALDAGAGSGFHSLLLSQLGVATTALEISPGMLEKLRLHFEHYDVKIKMVQSDFQHSAAALQKKFDAVFCLGNSLPHILEEEELYRAIQNFAELLEDRGVLLLQLLNYTLIMQKKEKILSRKQVDGDTYLRYYEYQKDLIEFHIVKIPPGAASPRSEHTVLLKPLQHKQLQQILLKTGFKNIQLYGGLALEPFDETASKDLVVTAERS
jgi:2-polyprenyl-3-methyl-5-hydroxy-6-metoxy-1,4-benzoquinol methylase